MKQIYFILPALLASCTLSPTYERPAVSTTQKWRNQEEQIVVQEFSAEWWKKFENEELNKLIADALAANNDIAQAVARVEQSRASLRIADSSLLPSADASAGIDFSKQRQSGRDNSSDSYNAGAFVAYEIDLFGRNRSNSYAADERLKASKFDKDAIELIVASDVARGYANYVTLNDRLEIANSNLANAEKVMKIVQARFDEGATSGLELAQQKASLANTRTSIASLEQQRESARNQLAILSGKAPVEFEVKGDTELKLPEIAATQPASLLERRPDVRAYEAGLVAANFDIGAARAEYFPSLSIGADIGLAANPIGSSAALATGVAGSLLQPLFRGGAIDAGVELSKARKDELVAGYKNVVLNAFKEVEDALSATNSSETRIANLATAASESQKAYDIARERYDAGSIDFQTLLDTERANFSAEDSLEQAKFDQLAAAVDLYKALGGGWKEE